jgi:hypothetical protein
MNLITMKIAKNLAFIFLCSIVHLSKIYAQRQDYVITSRGDTLKGHFIGKKFKAYSWDNAKRLDPSDYRETYQVQDNILIRSVFLPGAEEPVFISVLENGKIDLYQVTYSNSYMVSGPNGMWAAGGGSGMRLYAAKRIDSVKELDYTGSGTLQLKSKMKRMTVLSEMLKDNKDVYDKFIAEDRFNVDHIRNLIHLYNTGRPFGSDIPRDYIIMKTKDTIFCEIELGTINTITSRYRPTPEDRFTKIDTTIT